MAVSILQKIEAHVLNDASATCVYDATSAVESGAYDRISYRQLRERSAILAHQLEEKGVTRGGWCATDMENCASFIYLVLAAAYGGFTVVALNARLTDGEKRERLREVKRSQKLSDISLFHESDIKGLIDNAPEESFSEFTHRTQRALGSFDELQRAFVMFTSGTSGRPKAACLTWANLFGASRASNQALNDPGKGFWQLTLPMYHVGGLQILIRSLLNDTPLLLYRKFNAEIVLRDAVDFGCTHISVVDKTLQDLLAAPDASDIVPQYQCLLLGGSAPNIKTLAVALNMHARVYVSYGMTETCSYIASAPLVEGFDGIMVPLPEYKLVILAPDRDGFGQLAVRGPGVFSGYLNSQAAFTADGYFMTGDRARFSNGKLQVAERTGDMFVSGGENIYPEEIRKKLLKCEGVTEAYVFGAEDETWGRRPVAFVEASDAASQPDFNAQLLADQIRLSLNTRLAHIYMPREIIVLPEFPRSGIGKVDRRKLQRVFSERIRVVRVDIWRIKQPIHGASNARTSLADRESIIVQVTDAKGRTGIGEDVAFSSDWYQPETIDDDAPFINETLVPLVLGHVFVHPLEVCQLFTHVEGTRDKPLACAAIETALWDLYGKTTGRSIRQLIGGRAEVSEPGSAYPVRRGYVAGGVVVGIGTIKEVLRQVDEAVNQGYRRVKLKIKPGHDVKLVRAVREHHPDLTIMLDANQSYTDEQLDRLKELGPYRIACLEEPLVANHKPKVGPQNLFERLVRLQRELSYPICLDESWTTGFQLEEILKKYPDIRCVCMKIGKFGGVQPALDFYKYARAQGIMVWMGGMYDTGVSKRLHAAFATLPGMNLPGDISDTTRYFDVDITNPCFQLRQGQLEINPKGNETGLGCDLDINGLNSIAIQHEHFE